jgi:ankyrin repeat protein
VKQRLHAARKRLRITTLEADGRSAMEDTLQCVRASNDRAFSDAIALFLAIRCGDVAHVRALLQANPALVDARESWSLHDFPQRALPFPTRASPLIRAAELGQLAIVELLLQRGADVDGACGCATREPPLWAAVASAHCDVARALLEHGADPNRAGASGITPLHIAAMRGHSELAELLLAFGARTEPRDPGGRTAAEWAQHKGHAALAAHLRDSVTHAAPEPMRPVPSLSDGVWHTGIKAIDLLAPIAQGALVRVAGGAGVGRNVLLAELAYAASRDPETAVLWVNWERERWSGSELDGLLRETALRGRAHVMSHAHDEHTAAADMLAERALDFADGLLASGGARHVQLVFFEQPGLRAGVEALLPALRARATITTFVVSPWQDNDDARATLAPPYDALLAFDPALARAFLFPALDRERSRSRPIAALLGGELAERARGLLRRDDERARCLQAYLTQPFFVAEPNSGRPGESVTRAELLADVAALLDETATPVPREQLLYRGRVPLAR